MYQLKILYWNWNFSSSLIPYSFLKRKVFGLSFPVIWLPSYEQDLDQGPAKPCFIKRPHSKDFRFCSLYSLSCNYSTLLLWLESNHRHDKKWVGVTISIKLFTKTGSWLDAMLWPVRIIYIWWFGYIYSWPCRYIFLIYI